MTYELTLEQFSGPLHKLLELIEEQKLEINEISLAKVTNDFLNYIRKLERVEARMLTDFIVVASRLVLIKSRSLLPDFRVTAEEEGEIRELEARLKLYRELQPAQRILMKLWRAKRMAVSRPYFLIRGAVRSAEDEPPIFHPGRTTDAGRLSRALGAIAEIFQTFSRETQKIEDAAVTLEEKIQEIIRRLERGSEHTFTNLSDKKSRSEIIVIFLALLHLARESRVVLEQSSDFSDILIRSGEKK
ncbi:MAG: segregation/condensation protein A [Candidatus Liptonbacteria bacterium]|nr:segregation/condensation protein A [Candidatus Liptonbacteria bacterium]